MIVNGDISQIDLPRNVKSGLIDAQEKLKNIHQIDFVHFSAKDVVRHPVVAQIIRAYEPLAVKAEENQEQKKLRAVFNCSFSYSVSSWFSSALTASGS